MANACLAEFNLLLMAPLRLLVALQGQLDAALLKEVAASMPIFACGSTMMSSNQLLCSCTHL